MVVPYRLTQVGVTGGGSKPRAPSPPWQPGVTHGSEASGTGPAATANTSPAVAENASASGQSQCKVASSYGKQHAGTEEAGARRGEAGREVQEGGRKLHAQDPSVTALRGAAWAVHHYEALMVGVHCRCMGFHEMDR